MSEEIQIPQTAVEQKNNNENEKKHIVPTGVGIVIAILVVIGFLFLFFKFQKVSNPEAIQPVATIQSPSKSPISNEASKQENIPAAVNQAPESNSGNQVSGSSVDVDYELKKLDESANSINEIDFNSESFSDAQVGL